jgi:hypothetical protein
MERSESPPWSAKKRGVLKGAPHRRVGTNTTVPTEAMKMTNWIQAIAAAVPIPIARH